MLLQPPSRRTCYQPFTHPARSPHSGWQVSWGRRSNSCHVWEFIPAWPFCGEVCELVARPSTVPGNQCCLGVSLFALRKLPSPLFPGRQTELSLSSFNDLRNLINGKLGDFKKNCFKTMAVYLMVSLFKLLRRGGPSLCDGEPEAGRAGSSGRLHLQRSPSTAEQRLGSQFSPCVALRGKQGLFPCFHR